MRILVIDDEDSIINLIRMNLILEGYEVITCKNGKEALKSFENENPDLVLLDLMLPDMDGYEVMKEIQKLDGNKPIILITAQNGLNSKLLGLQLGADDYITKPFDNRELILRIRAIWRRINKCKLSMINTVDKVENNNEINCGPIRLFKKERKVLIDNREVKLTYKEFDILHTMLQNKEKVFTRDELLQKIWGYNFIGNSRAVDILIKRLREKMGPYKEFIETVYGVGYKFEVKSYEK